ncbi:helix-turn-helix transcriptional regulator [Cyclobacterium qasimii]|uniref:HTH deoR-type domain-containing protein n=2 Tax=Cyclobacterium qasimii TaxID=1350429 RepID=A0A512CEP5_9BACT|nr:YafY family protein [Cyclobacterium qasimii]EPR68748.1 putative transcriptional regulator [Cyclobacterium qasimii M12-11B]GEO22682.1 hypothetical protein CQA01_32160 [Cyclobacterium qasimii]
MNRLNRLTAILTQLQSKRHITAEEISKRFDISLRTVYRDVRALEEAGVPLTGETGKGYALVEGYRLPPVMFDEKEAYSLLLAEKVIEQFTDREISERFKSALIKIKSVLKDRQKYALDHLDQQVAFYSKDIHDSNRNEQVIQGILSGLADNSVLQFNYTSFLKEENTSRAVEPVGMYYSKENWYLIAYCKLREDYRTFRIDRIRNLEIGEAIFNTNHPTLKAYLKKMEEGHELTKIVIQMEPSFVKYIDTQKYNHGFVLQETIGQKVQLTFMVGSLEYFARWVISLADIINVIQPKALSDRLEVLLTTMIKKLKEGGQTQEAN